MTTSSSHLVKPKPADVASKEEEYLQTLVEQGRRFAKSGRVQEAIDLFERILKYRPNDAEILGSYAKAMRDAKEYEKAFVLFDRSLELEPDDVITLNTYANILAQQGNYKKAFTLFDRLLELESGNSRTLATYANLLAKQGEYEKAFTLFDRSLALEPDNVITLRAYANILVKQGEYEKSFVLFDRSLALESGNPRTLATYANILAQQGEYKKAFTLFDRSLALEPDNLITLRSYANLLAKQGEYEKSFTLFDRSLELELDNLRTLATYANILAQQGEYEKASTLFDRLLVLEPDNVITLTSYANLLVKQGELEEAIHIFNKAVNLRPDDVVTLTSYANVLAQSGQNAKAFQIFEQALNLDRSDTRTISYFTDALLQAESWARLVELRPDYSYARLKYAQALESEGQYQTALAQLSAIDLSDQQNYHANLVRLSMGRLYDRLHQPDKAIQLIQEAIENSDDADKDKSRLYAARSLLASNSQSEEAIEILREVQKTSPRYQEAMKTIALNAKPETTYELFAGEETPFSDTTMLYRSMYHKIGNEIAILKSIAQRLLRKVEGEHPLVQEIVEDLEALQESVTRQRATEKATIASSSRENYKKLIELVSKTAHDIADEVNNSLAAIVSKVRRILRKLPEDSVLQQSFEKLLVQLELTQNALNDLKSINEGIKIRHHRFLVCKLFEKWEPQNWSNTPRINRARIKLNIENSNSEFDGDEEKIKSILNELIENALKQNASHKDLCIWIRSQDLLNPSDIAMPTIPGDRKYLFIQVTDNGKGIPEDKKEWIFQPLNTTSSEEKGSGLGLFIARKTLQKMGGSIREIGDPGRGGARFQIYIPYLSNNEY